MNKVKRAFIPVFAILALFLAHGCAGAPQKAEKTDDKEYEKTEKLKRTRAVIQTKYGEIEIRFFPQDAPKHVENFLFLAQRGFYDGTIFHRVIPGFMIQGGDPLTTSARGTDTSNYGNGGPGYTIPGEFNGISHLRGIVSMARAEDPDSAGSQFFIVVGDSPHLDRLYTVFGRVVRGMDVADRIATLARDSKDMPYDRVEMKVKIIEKEKQ